MKKITLFLFLILLAQLIVGQDFKLIDESAKKAPNSAMKDVESLEQFLSKPAKNDMEKIRAFYIWITHNISYDLNAFLNNELTTNTSTEDFLKRKKGVCQDYADLFKALCDAAEIKCYVVSGYSKGFGVNSRTQFAVPDHAWNAVYIDGAWQLIDATWGSGYVNEKTKFVQSFNERFFLGKAQSMILTHLPIDPMWQLLDCPIEIEDFKKEDEVIQGKLKKQETCFEFNDSIEVFDKLSKLEQDLKTAISSYNFNPRNKINIGLAYLNYGASKSQTLIAKQQELEPAELLKGFREVMRYYEKSKEYLKSVTGKNGQELRNACNQNIKNTRSNIKQLEEFLNQ